MPVYNYTTLDDPSAGSGGATFAFGINDAGQIVGFYQDSLSHQHGFLYSGATYTAIDDPLGTNGTVATAINNAGRIVGNYSDSSFANHGFFFNGAFDTLDDPSAADGPGTFATGVNDLGWIVGFYNFQEFEFGFLTGDGIHYTHIEDPLDKGGFNGGSVVRGTSYNPAKGLIYNVGGYFDGPLKEHGFFNDFFSNTYVTIDDPLGTRTEAEGVNSAGQIVGWYQDSLSHQHGFLYSGGTYTTIDDPLGTNGTVATGINNSGQIVGYYTDSNGTAHGFLRTIAPNPPPPAGTTADMILRHGADGFYEIYDIGKNSLLAAYELGQVGTDWQFVTLGGFFGSDTTDMLLRNSNTGGFEVYDISNNLITNAAFLGTVGLDWKPIGFGNFSSPGENDMILRNVNTGGVEVYDLRNNQITGANFMGTVGLDWQTAGFGDFDGDGATDMMLRNSNTGQFEVYNIRNNAISSAEPLGTVGTDWFVVGFADFNGDGTTDMMLANPPITGAAAKYELYDISNNAIVGAHAIGAVGQEWSVAGFGPISGPGDSDMVLHNRRTGAFEVYDIANDALSSASSLGQVGLDWQLGGFAADPPTGSMGSSDDQPASNAQLVQAMAGFGGGSGAGESLNTAPLGSDTSQQALLTTPQHA
jgi:probable HAF family extracellular repeat protein